MVRHCCGMSLAWAVCENQTLLKVVKGVSVDSVLTCYKLSSLKNAVKIEKGKCLTFCLKLLSDRHNFCKISFQNVQMAKRKTLIQKN